eukprot:TRINITY_DN2725_c0_g1_i1.p1 TRINITY_DN2725_c0_g1~~TRINITY_DN2725_c0_g1_i1.p1  ORF type:complete len:332 (+),score=46.70 TRINITY_DN2725_c0_g1_i1:209-1204(+)
MSATSFEFEGVEKKLEIRFVLSNSLADPKGLRNISRDQWAEMLKLIKCTILSKTSNEHFDAYVLSESSLFVYPTKIVLKTCGTTRTLLCMDYLLAISQNCLLSVEFVSFSRKNFRNPEAQFFPHTSFDEEVDFLNKHFQIGKGYTMGSTSSDHWNIYIADFTNSTLPKPSASNTEKVVEIMMTELDSKAMEIFYKDTEKSLSPTYAKDVTHSSGIADILPGAITDEFMFDPCGYSVNGLLGESYFTIHVTPEPSCSFVSFETNCPVPSYQKLVECVVSIFKPSKFQVSLRSDASENTKKHISGLDVTGCRLINKSHYQYENCDVVVGLFHT